MICYFNSRETMYKRPFGAIESGNEVEFFLKIEASVYPRDVSLKIRKDGEEPIYISASFMCCQDEMSLFTVRFTPTSPGIYFYSFVFQSNFGQKEIRSRDDGSGVIDGGSKEYQLTVYEALYKSPDGFLGGIMYQIFPDRFCFSGKKKSLRFNDRIIRADKAGVPYFKADENGIVPNNDFFEGDFDGIIKKLHELHDLGVSIIYLNPIFEAHSNHRYDTADYMKCDELLGTEKDFKRLCDKAHKYGIKIILDGVFSHTGADSVYFNKTNRYDSIGAHNDKSSPYYSWYTFRNYPDDYECWWDILILPNTNENDPGFTEFICGENGVLKHWLSLGADGFRLDVADELPDEFLENVYSAVKKYKPEAIVLGEVWEDASNKISYNKRRRFLLGRQMDSVMNYPFKDSIINLLKNRNIDEFKNSVMSILENYPKNAINYLMNFLSTHDTKRILTELGGESSEGKSKDWMSNKRLTESEREYGISLLKVAFTLLYFLPGNPCIYYGDEIGMEGYGDPFNRMYYSVQKADTELKNFVKKLGKIRRENIHKFIEKNIEISKENKHLMTIRLGDDKNGIIIALNLGNETENIEFLQEKYDLEMFSTTAKDSEFPFVEPLECIVFNFSTI